MPGRLDLSYEKWGSLIDKLHKMASTNDREGAKSILDEFPDMLDYIGELILEYALRTKSSSDFVKEFLNYEQMSTPKEIVQDLSSDDLLNKMDFNDIQRLFLQTITGGMYGVAKKLLNKYKESLSMARYDAQKLTALSMPQLKPPEEDDQFGNGAIPEIMIKDNENLRFESEQEGLLLVHLAAIAGLDQSVRFLCSPDLLLLEEMGLKDAILLFFLAISRSIYDVADKLLEKYPKQMSIARYGEKKLTALHMLLRKPPSEKFVPFCKEGPAAVQSLLWINIMKLEDNEISELVTKPSNLLFEALESGHIDFLKWIISDCAGAAITINLKDPRTEMNLLHFVAVSHQHEDIFDFIRKNWIPGAHIALRAVDKDRNNVLHFAACQRPEATTNLEPHDRMKRDLEWFEYVEKRVPRELRKMRNKDGKTPEEMFCANHAQLSEEVKGVAKTAANSGMVVGGLIVTVTFAAALTTPGDNKSSVWFTVFILTNAVSLFASCLSIIAFLSIFTSSKFTGISHFIISQPPNLGHGKMLLLLSVITMVIAFIAASFLIFAPIHKGAAYLVTALGFLTIIMLLKLFLNIISDTLLPYFKSIYDVFSKQWKLLAETLEPYCFFSDKLKNALKGSTRGVSTHNTKREGEREEEELHGGDSSSDDMDNIV